MVNVNYLISNALMLKCHQVVPLYITFPSLIF
jgi:hypothetical protein